MPRYVAFLRGVSPMNAKMADLKVCFEKIGCTDVKTIMSSGNVAFTGAPKPEPDWAQHIEAGMAKHLPRGFPVLLRSRDYLLSLLKADPFAALDVLPTEKRVVTFLGEPHHEALPLPIALDGARILAVQGTEAFTAYTPHARGPVFMALIEKTLGKNVTTRTWDTLRKCAVA
ncbi:MAG: DUF1697 domain-containing protein [Proteobacteria bacterium]|nr:DUF1697 domain-containing protein [Pseudomonadota bacterium]